MRAIGFRAAPAEVTYAIVEGDGDSFRILNTDALVVPPALLPPNQLHYLRTVLLDVMREYEVQLAGLRLAEGTAKKTFVFRANIEGVLQELLASSSVTWYFTGRKDRIASLLGYTDRTELTRLIDGDENPPYSDSWGTLSKNEREAILASCAAISGRPGGSFDESLTGVGGHV